MPISMPIANYQTSYFDTLDLSDISEFEDYMTTSSDEDIPPSKMLDTENTMARNEHLISY